MPESGESRLGRHPLVLVVDDEPPVARALRTLLQDDFEVELVGAADQALERIVTGDPVDVVVCDLNMPGTTGVELHRRVAEEVPELAERFVFLTGGGSTPSILEFVERTHHPVFRKPVSEPELRAAIYALLAPTE